MSFDMDMTGFRNGKASSVAPALDVLLAAGVAVGDAVIWRWDMPLLGLSDPSRMTVVGVHRNAAGVAAVEVSDEHGMKYRAYPGELTVLKLVG